MTITTIVTMIEVVWLLNTIDYQIMDVLLLLSMTLSVYVYIYIYIYILSDDDYV